MALNLIINEDSPTFDALFADLTLGGIGALRDFANGDSVVKLSVKAAKRVNGVITDSYVAGDTLYVGIGDGTNPPVCSVTLSIATPATGNLAINTTGMVALFAATSANQITLEFSVYRIRASGESGTIYQADTTIHRAAIDPSTAVPTPSLSFYSFKTIAVSGQSDIVAASLTDTLTFAAAGTTVITTNATTKTVTITSSGGSISTTNALWVDKSGSDANAGTLAAPFLTLAAAMAAASSGTTNHGGPGSYAQTASIAKAGVSWDFASGTTITRSSAVDSGIIDDGGSSMTFAVTGNAALSFTFSGSDYTAAVRASHASSNIAVRCRSITSATTSPGLAGVLGVYGKAGTLFVECSEFISASDALGGTSGIAIYWENGNNYIRSPRITGTDVAIWSQVTATPTGDLFVDADIIETTSAASVGLLYGVILDSSTNSSAATWVRAGIVKSPSVIIAAVQAGYNLASGRLYVTAQKIFGRVEMRGASDSLLYVNADKISGLGNGATTRPTLFYLTGGTARVACRQWDPSTYTGQQIKIIGGTAYLTGGDYTGGSSANGIEVTGGTVYLENMVIDTSANSSTDALTVSGGTVYLINCKLISNAGRKDIVQSGGTVTVTGGSGTGTLGAYTTTGTVGYTKAPTALLADTATALAATRTIGGSNFDGTGNVTSFPIPGAIGGTTPAAGAFTTVSATGQVTSTLATGTAPLVIASTTLVANLYVARAVLADSATTNANLTGAVTSVGNATSLGSFSSANLLAALTTSTGTGSNVFSIAPSFTGTVSAVKVNATATSDYATSLQSLSSASNYITSLAPREFNFYDGTYSMGLRAATMTGNYTLTVPALSGNANAVTTNDTGTVTNTMLAGSIDLTTKVTGALPQANIAALTGDVTKPSGSGVTTLANIPAISGANLTTLNASNISSGTLADARNTVSNATTTSMANLVTVGTLTGGSTGAGFTVALSTATITGSLADARLSANVPLINASNTYTGTTNSFTIPTTTGLTTAAGVAFNANSLTTGTGLYLASSTLTSGKAMDIQISGTAAIANHVGLNIAMTGATSTNAITTTGATISNTRTNATSGTNVALTLTASGATTGNTALNVTAGQILVPENGNTVGVGTSAGVGIAWSSSVLLFQVGNGSGNEVCRMRGANSEGIRMAGTYAYAWSPAAPSAAGSDTYLIRGGAAGTVQLGILDATTPVAQVLKAHNVTTGTGASLTIAGGTGSAAGGAVNLATSATTGAPVTRVAITSAGAITLGAGTSFINVRHGISGAMVLGAVTVTDTGCTANTRCFFAAHTLGTISIPGGYYASTRNASTSFVITSSQATETSTIDWIAFEP